MKQANSGGIILYLELHQKKILSNYQLKSILILNIYEYFILMLSTLINMSNIGIHREWKMVPQMREQKSTVG